MNRNFFKERHSKREIFYYFMSIDILLYVFDLFIKFGIFIYECIHIS